MVVVVVLCTLASLVVQRIKAAPTLTVENERDSVREVISSAPQWTPGITTQQEIEEHDAAYDLIEHVRENNRVIL